MTTKAALIQGSSCNLEATFEREVRKLPASRETKAYIVGLFLDQARVGKIVDLSKESIVLAHMEVRRTHDFAHAQRVGDWSLWILSWFPESVRGCETVYESLGRLGYYRCYRILPSWRIYEELADCLPSFVERLHAEIHSS